MPQGLSLSNYRAALFDVDGTLVDSLGVYVRGLGDAYEHFLGKRPERAELLALCGIPLRVQLTLFQDVPPTPEKLAEMIEYTLERYRVHERFETTFEAAIETLRLCHRAGLKTALVTSKNDVELTSFLKRFPAADAIHTAVCASDVHHPKPHPESAILACSRLGVEPHQAVMIGDSKFDIQCARDAGATPIAVGYGSADRATLLAESPAAFFETADDLLEWARNSLLEPTCLERSKTN